MTPALSERFSTLPKTCRVFAFTGGAAAFFAPDSVEISMARRLIIALAIVPLLTLVGGIWALRAQTIGCGNTIFGKLNLITSAFAQTISVPCGGGGPPPVACSGGGQLAFNSTCNTIFQHNFTIGPFG